MNAFRCTCMHFSTCVCVCIVLYTVFVSGTYIPPHVCVFLTGVRMLCGPIEWLPSSYTVYTFNIVHTLCNFLVQVCTHSLQVYARVFR